MSTEWHKSSYSGSSANCVEVREASERVDVRDTRNRDAGHLSFTSPEWVAAVAAEK
ncbi:DUF397 domain-containing protein [Nocardiopsis lambiniae]|uniref:DUF397 domain-containing protein n=1 Tax=Nocardiopsis lambiniae TaxID=3075539 RepID=A0ABU2M642_9ACTN|nr:DUF397 domain-containing protein [Nocardiopsis sp. DSM 44743]MDT0328139.1 DUF397 domain-containing protein [Nocardiopsis sp. DSM 44743]